MESQPQNPEFRNYPENFHPCINETFKNWACVSIIEEYGSIAYCH